MHPYHEEPNGEIAPSVRDAVLDVVQHTCKPTFMSLPCISD
jgi:ATP-dependent Clp protease ATP-binding subunit ClpB